MKVDVGIVGAGLAGLACALRLGELGLTSALYESSDRVGGRVATDEVEGYLLDRGFQVLLDSYPEAHRRLDLEALGARAFAPGALVRKGERFHRVVDPWRSPLQGAGTLRAPFVTLGDAFRMASLRRRATRGSEEREPGTTAQLLERLGFSSSLRESFFRPFFGGVTLDPDLDVPAWFFLSLFGWFSKGSAVLPARGMGAIASQLAAALPEASIHLSETVASVSSESIELESGARLPFRAVVVATDAGAARRLLGASEAQAAEWLGTTTLYYAAQRSPVGEAILVLNGEGRAAGPVNHLCVLSDAQPSYAPAGSSLISVSLLGVPATSDEELDREVREQLTSWYGSEVSDWRRLRVDRIPHALPRLSARRQGVENPDGPLLCGDHVATPSIQGALESGRRAAQAVLARLEEAVS